MDATDISGFARHLFETQGAKAIAEAARKAASYRDAGDAEQTKFWQRVEARNKNTAAELDRLGLAEYFAMEAYVVAP